MNYLSMFFASQVHKLVVMAGPHVALSEVNLTWKQLLKSWYIFMFQV